MFSRKSEFLLNSPLLLASLLLDTKNIHISIIYELHISPRLSILGGGGGVKKW